jgi:hypothetical protein
MMRHISIAATATLMSTVTGVLLAVAQTNPASPSAPASPASATAPGVAEQADRLLKEMGDFIGSAQQFTFHAKIAFDHVLPTGQKLEFQANEEVALKRPGRLYVQWSGDLGNRQLWDDGKLVYDPGTRFYGTAAAPATVDAMLDQVDTALGFSPPLSDLLYSHPYQAVRGNDAIRHVPRDNGD